MTNEQMLKELPALRGRVQITFSVEDKGPLRRSWRYGFVRRSVSTILYIHPILHCKDGVVVADVIARGKQDIIQKLIEKVPTDAKEVIVNYGAESDMAHVISDLIRQKSPHTAVSLQCMGPVLLIHLLINLMPVLTLISIYKPCGCTCSP